MNTLVEEYQVGRCKVEIHWDNDASSPRENSNLGTIAHWHRDYDFGTRISDPSEFLKELAREKISANYPDSLFENNWSKILDAHFVVLPIALLDHSGLHMWVGSGHHWCDPGGWDSGQVGFVYVSLEDARKSWSTPSASWLHKVEWRKSTPSKIDRIGKIITPYSFEPCKITLREATRKVIESEIKQYDHFLSGQCFGYVVTAEDGRGESCWGFVGDSDYVKERAYSVAEQLNLNMDEADRMAAIVEHETAMAETYP